MRKAYLGSEMRSDMVRVKRGEFVRRTRLTFRERMREERAMTFAGSSKISRLRSKFQFQCNRIS